MIDKTILDFQLSFSDIPGQLSVGAYSDEEAGQDWYWAGTGVSPLIACCITGCQYWQIGLCFFFYLRKTDSGCQRK